MSSTQPTPVRLLSEQDVSEFLGLTAQTLRTWRSRRKGPPFRKLGGAVRYVESDVLAWVAAQPRVETAA